MTIIDIENSWLMYKIPFTENAQIVWDNFWALKDISLSLEKGQSLGIIGENGSGKSTLLKLIAGLLKPDRGNVRIQGRACGLLELGAGFEPELTGKENVELNARLFGLDDSRIKAVFDDIVEFAQIGRFINAPVKCYSQGMFVRLAFATAIHMQPEILLIDDSLAVGDKYFQKKCIQKIFELKEQGLTIVFVCHDMNLLKRLCQRAVLLKNGRVIKDDETDKVIEVYTQTQGAPQGVGVVKKNELSAVFNNGRLIISHQDQPLSFATGLFADFRSNGKWYNSLQAAWTVSAQQPDSLTAKGEFFTLGLEQTWKIKINEKNELLVNVELGSDQPQYFEIEESVFNIMLRTDYDRWSCPQTEGDLPQITEQDNKWQAIVEEGIFRQAVGLLSSKEPGLPAVAIENQDDEAGIYTRIFNTDFATQSRAVQYKKFKLCNFAQNQADRAVIFSGKLIVAVADMKKYIQDLQDEFTLRSKDLAVKVSNGQCVLQSRGHDLTKSNHIHCLLFAQGKWYSSHRAKWHVKKSDENTLTAQITWPNLPLIQQWTIQKAGDNIFRWDAALSVQERLSITQAHVYAMFSEKYDNWYSDYGKGKFPEAFIETEVDLLQRCIAKGKMILSSSGAELPDMAMSFGREPDNFAKIFNSDAAHRARVVRIDKIQPENKICFEPGEYPCFKLDISAQTEQAGYRTADKSDLLKADDLSLVFEQGRARLFWQGREITKQLGLYTSLCAQGRWHDSHSKAVWDIIEQSPGRLKVSGKWMQLPVCQTWEIELSGGDTISMNMRMEVKEEIQFDWMQASLMLSEKYTHWQTQNSGSEFPDFEKEADDTWQLVCPIEKTEFVAVRKSNGLAAVKMYADKDSPTDSLCVLNSDVYHRSRLLQHRIKDPKIFKPGQYDYFQGKIIVC